MKLDFREIDEKTGVIRLPKRNVGNRNINYLEGIENIKKLSIVLGEILPCYSKLNNQLKWFY